MNDLAQTVLKNQCLAADPRYNVWVNASAGSGKTKVLIDRILRLLLVGEEPGAIFCITFTKAAAVEMQERLQRHLENWVLSDDDALRKALSALDPDLEISPSTLLEARKLYNRVLDDPVQIQTIHALAQQMLQGAGESMSVPFGAELAPELVVQQLAQSTVSKLLLKEDLSEIYRLFSRSKFQDIVQAILQDRAFFRFVLMDGFEGFKTRLNSYLNTPIHPVEIEGKAIDLCNQFDVDIYYLIKHSAASDKDRRWLEDLQHALKSRSLEALCVPFLTAQGKQRKKLLSKKLGEVDLVALGQIHKFANHITELDQELKRWKLLQSSSVVVRFAEHFLEEYSRAKQQLGVWDYDDLIFTVIEQLSTPGAAEDLLFKLDQRIDHILIDEAQDTNMYQWKLLDGLIEGLLQRQELATVFVVGDHKQSIFGFQGTDPNIFHTMQMLYQSKPTHREWKQVDLNISFRTLQGVLDKVDMIFEHLNIGAEYTQHKAFRGQGGKFKVFSLVTQDEDRDIFERFASGVADTVDYLKDSGCVASWGDIMLLIRRRGEHLEAIQEEFKRRNIPFASPNHKLTIEDPLVSIIVRIIVLKVQPYDHENILQILLNPLLNINEQALTYAEEAVAGSQLKGEGDLSRFNMVSELLAKLEDISSFQELYLVVLVLLNDRLSITDENITNAVSFLNTYISYAKWLGAEGEMPEGYLYARKLEQAQSMSVDASALQIMTVHGAKGLQSKQVVLADTTQLVRARYAFMKEESNHLVLCASASLEEPKIYEDLKLERKANELLEYYRLLYVALTRAENGVSILGFEDRKLSEDSWYSKCMCVTTGA